MSKSQQLLEATKVALDNLANIASRETIQSAAYHDTRMTLLLAIERFEAKEK